MPTVLLATTMSWPFAAQLAGAFAQTGARVEALCPPSSPLHASRYPVALHRYQPLAPGWSLRKAMAAAKPDLVIPCDDLAGELMQPPLGRQDFLSRAALVGAPVAHSMAIATHSELEDAIRQFGLPLVIKCDASWGGDGVVIAQTREEASEAMQKFSSLSRLRDVARAIRRKRSHFLTRALFPVPAAVSAQRFIAGRPATSAIACWQGRVVGAHHFDVVTASGDTGPAGVVAHTECPQMTYAAGKIARAFNLSGLFGLDYIRDAKGAVHLLEMNARAVPTSHLALSCDLAAALLGAAGLAARSRPLTPAREVALFPREWLRDPSSPWLKSALHDVPWDDPGLVQAAVAAALPAQPDAAKAFLKTAQERALTFPMAVSRV